MNPLDASRVLPASEDFDPPNATAPREDTGPTFEEKLAAARAFAATMR